MALKSVDDLFSEDMAASVADSSPDALTLEAIFGEEIAESLGILDDDIELAEDDSGGFPGWDSVSSSFRAGEAEDPHVAGVGSADDDEEVPIPSDIVEGPELKKKRGKRTARSKAHAEKKARQRAAEQQGSGGVGEADFVDSPAGNAGTPGRAGSAGTPPWDGSEMGRSDRNGGQIPSAAAASGYVETVEVSTIEPAPAVSKRKKRKKSKSQSLSASASVGSSPAASAGASAAREARGSESAVGAGVGVASAAGRASEDYQVSSYADLPEDESDQEQVDLPDWADSIRRKVNANVAHAFLLNGNVRDYMVRNIAIKDGIVAVLDGDYEAFDIIAEYDQAHGLSFYGEDIEIGGAMENGAPRTLAHAYKERFIEEMHEAQRWLSIPETPDIPNRDPVALFAVLSVMFDRPSKTRDAKILLFIDYSDLLVPDASSSQMKPDERKLAITLSDIGRSQAADDAGNVLIFITDDMTQLSTRIRNSESRIEQVKIPIPDRDERLDFIEHVLDVPENTLSDGTQIFEHPDSISREMFAINSAGLSRIQIEDIVLRSLSEDEPLTLELMKERKQEIIREDYDDVLEIVDPKTGFEMIGGMQYMKDFFREEIIEPVHAGEREQVPMGTILLGPPGSGKATICSSRLFTEKGQVIAGKIKIGDFVYCQDGMLHMIIGVYPQGKLPVYEIVLGDGRTVKCSEDHIWPVLIKSHGKYVPKEYTVREMIDKGVLTLSPADIRTGRNGHSRFYLPQCAPVQYPERDFPVDPYAVGAFLGDGSCCARIAIMICSETDIDIIKNVSESIGYPYKPADKGGLHWCFIKEPEGYGPGKDKLLQIKELFSELPEVRALAYEKHIPEQYKYGSVEQRYSLLQGLMDTDGSISSSDRHNARFCSVSKELCEDVMEVANSLGYSCTMRCSDRAGKLITGSKERQGKEYFHQSDLYEVIFNIPNEEKQKLFRCKRKKEIALEAAKHPKKRHYDRIPIVEIRDLGYEEEMVCFTVTSPDHTYLVENYVVTHNTMISKAVAKEAGMNFVALNLNRIMEKWVGSTERNLDRALDCALAMAPTIIFIDEIDEALPNRADPNASSVNKRINQRLLTFFSDTTHRGEVVILAATNYPEKIDPAFKRAGRFDMRIPIFAPDEFDRMRIMRSIAKGAGYTFSWFDDPDTIVPNPFVMLDNWIKSGNIPLYDDTRFTGDREMYIYEVKDANGEPERHEVYIPKRTINILGKSEITLQQLYENVEILMPDMPKRLPDASTGEVDTDKVYMQKIADYIASRTDILGHDDNNHKAMLARVWKWEKIYSVFAKLTFQMTGAELSVVMLKAQSLYKKWKRKKGLEVVEQMIASGALKSDRDIPWHPFLEDACRKTVKASSGIKRMEDMALLNTSDIDFIPDALYGNTDENQAISYRDRHQQLILRNDAAKISGTEG